MLFNQAIIFLKLTNAYSSQEKQNYLVCQFLISILCSSVSEGEWIEALNSCKKCNHLSLEDTLLAAKMSVQLLFQAL